MANITIVFICLIFVKAVVCYNVDFHSFKTYQGRNNSYFGYAVELVPNSDLSGRRILVGAPKDITSYDKSENADLNYENKMTGSIYVCSSFTDCTHRMSEVMLDENNLKGEGQMLGASIVVKNNITIVCAPRWIQRQNMIEDWMKGRCIRGENLSFKQEINLTGNGKEMKFGQPLRGMAASGFSSAILLDGTRVFGIPGYKEFSGGFVVETKTKDISFHPITEPSAKDLSGYMGYALAVGDFKGTFGRDQYIMAGVPRRNDKGAVIVFENDQRNHRVIRRTVMSGKQMGSYYGASLCAVDLDDDGLDDLIVGAPSYYDHHQKIETGRVYAHKNTFYRRKPNFENENTIILSGDVHFGSRFGTAISHLGDINHDGVPDIAVGAPFEQNGKGAVYIFNIDFAKKTRKLIQKLTVARSRGFGFHISKGLDLDGNLYADFAVGAFLSDEVHLFYTRNIIQLDVDLTVSPRQIEQRDSEVKFTFCMRASDVNKRSNNLILPIDCVLIMDTEEDNSRLTISTRQGYQRKVKHQLVIQSQNPNFECTSFYALYHKTEDIMSPIRVELSADISDKFHAQRTPVLVKSVFSDLIRFEIKCFDEQKCIADLAIQLHSEPAVIIFNKTSIMDVRVNITNMAEPANVTMANVTVTGSVVYRRVTTIKGNDVQCLQIQSFPANTSKQFTLQCYVSNVLFRGEQSVFDLTLDVSQMKYNNEHKLIVTSITTSGSEEKIDNLENNKAELLIHIKHETSIIIDGISKPVQMTYIKGTKSHYLINHEYNIWNNGPSSLLPTSVHFNIPLKRDVITEIGYTDPEVSNCTVVVDERSELNHGRNTIFPSTISSTNTELSTSAQTDTSATSDTATRMKIITQEKRRSLHSFTKITSNEKRIGVTCERREHVCTKVRCKLDHINSETEVKITFKLNFTENELRYIISDGEIVVIETEGMVEEPKSTRHIQWKITVEDTTETVLVPLYPYRKVRISFWIIIVSVAGGVVIVIGVTRLCYSLGFFNRPKKQEVKTWKRKRDYYEYKRKSRLSSSGACGSTENQGCQKSSVHANEGQDKCDRLEGSSVHENAGQEKCDLLERSSVQENEGRGTCYRLKENEGQGSCYRLEENEGRGICYRLEGNEGQGKGKSDWLEML